MKNESLSTPGLLAGLARKLETPFAQRWLVALILINALFSDSRPARS